VMVTNGGYGGVQMALSYGVPLVVAGASEDKPEVGARVAWSGAGLNLKTGKPSRRPCVWRCGQFWTIHATAPGRGLLPASTAVTTRSRA
jgi:hypothetical protein